MGNHKRLLRYILPSMRVRNFLLVLSSVGLFWYAQPNPISLYGQPVAGLFWMVPLLFALRDATRLRWAYLTGALFFTGVCFSTEFWLASFGGFSAWTLGSVWFGYMAFHATTVMPFLWFIVGRNSVLARSRYTNLRPFLVAATWSAWELIMGNGPAAFPWVFAAYPFNNTLPVIQIASLGGTALIGFVIILFQASLAELLFSRQTEKPLVYRGQIDPLSTSATATKKPSIRRYWTNTALPGRALIFSAGTWVVTLTFGFIALAVYQPGSQPSKPLNVVMVQQNEDSWKTSEQEYWNMVSATEQLSLYPAAGAFRSVNGQTPTTDVRIWSESSLRHLLNESQWAYKRNPVDRPFLSFLSEGKTPLITGAPHRYRDGFSNAAIILSPQGQELDWYGKQALIPFAEYVPGWENPVFRAFVQDAVGLTDGGWTHGPGPGIVMELPLKDGSTIPFGAPICFEDAFNWIPSDMARQGAHVLINLTNNSWSGTMAAQSQHFSAARFRAVETHLPLIRSTNGGLSCVVRPDGHMEAVMPMFEQTSRAVTVDIPTNPGLTPFVILGDWFAWLCMAISVGSVVYFGVIVPRLASRKA